MIRILAIALAVVVMVALMLGWRSSHAVAQADKAKNDLVKVEEQLKEAQDAVGFLNRTLETERTSAKAMSDIGANHEEDRSKEKDVPAAIAAGIRDGTLILRKQHAACETSRLSDTVASTVERDALAKLREADHGNLVRVGREADNHVKACQAVIDAQQKQSAK